MAPKEFDACVGGGGRVRTITPKTGVYMHVCFPKGGGPSVSGEIKHTKEQAKSKTTK